ncbi:MAG: UbiA family prenyltransferase [Pseudomonadota bacterium]
MNKPPALVVDLDGTLVRSDLLGESYLEYLRRQPLSGLRPFLWLRDGRASMKARLAKVSHPDIETLPYEHAVMAQLRTARESGRETVLATASDRQLAQRVADHLGLFDRILASEPGNNLKGAAKAAALVKLYGERGFDYAGDSAADLPVWATCHTAFAVNPGRGVYRRLLTIRPDAILVGRDGADLPAAWRALRPHHWLKNLLLFAPLVASHRILDDNLLGEGILAFLCFCLCTSAVYLINDLIDLPLDRRHAEKCHRPLAAGDLPLWTAVALILLGLSIAFTTAALLLPAGFTLAMLVYFTLTALYSLWAKRIAIVDIVFLVVLYTLRVVAGALALEIEASTWIIALVGFMFLSLSLLKRYAELHAVRRSGSHEIQGRAYTIDDMELVAGLGASSGYIAVLVLALYIADPTSEMLYEAPGWLWGACAVTLFWISYMWLLARRGQIPQDPVMFAVTDPRSLLSAGLLCLLMWLAA